RRQRTRRHVNPEGREAHRQGVSLAPTPTGPLLEQLRPSRAQDEQRHSAGPVDEFVHEVEQALVRPVEILEDQHDGVSLGKGLDEAPPRCEALGAPVAGGDLPMPGTPIRVTSWTDGCERARASASRRASSSRSRPMSCARPASNRSTPNRARACTATRTGVGSAFPLAVTGSASRYSITCSVAWNGVLPTSTPLTGAAACSRAVR